MEKLDQLKKEIEKIQAKSVVASDMRAFITLVLSVIKKSKEDFEYISKENLAVIQEAVKYIESEHSQILKGVEKENNKTKSEVMAEMEKSMKDMRAMCEELMLQKPLDGENGKDADPEVVAKIVLEKIPKAETETGETIADKLEALKGNARLDASAIKNMPEFKGYGGLGSTARNLWQLQDVSIVGTPTNGQVLKYNGTTNVWEPGTGGAGTLDGSGTANEIAYWVDSDTLGSLAVATYPSLTELSYVKGLTSALQTQLNSKLTQVSADLLYAPISVTQYTDELAQDAVGNALGTGLAYNDGTGAVSLSHLGIQSLTDPNANVLMGWDDTDGAVKFLTIGTGLSYDHATHTISSTATGGYTNLTEFVAQTPWRVFYSDANGDVQELALGADGTFLKSNGASVAPSFATPAGSGDMVLADVQSVTGLKTFDKDKLAMKGTSTGITTLSTANTGASNYVATLQASTGTLAYLTDIPVVTNFATKALDNLASVAINTSLISDTDATDDLGSALIKWNNIFGVNLGSTGTRFTTGWFTDLTVTNAIAGSVTGNAGTVTNGVYTTGAGTVFLAPNGDGTNLTGVLHSLSGAVLTDQTIGQTIGATGARLTKLWATDITVTNAIAGSVTGSAATLSTPRAIYGNNFDGSAALTQIIASTYGGTGNGFTKFTGPTTAEKTFTLPDASATLLYSGGALGTPSSGTLTNATGLPIAGLVASTSTAIGVGSIELGHATDTTLSRVSAGVVAVEGKTLVNLTDGGTFAADISVPDEAYGAGWNGSLEVPTKNAVYDKIEALGGGGAPTMKMFTMFETVGAFTVTSSGGTSTFGVQGLTMDTTATTTRYTSVRREVGSDTRGAWFAGSPIFTSSFELSLKGATGQLFFGIGDITVAGAGHTFTSSHIGFKVISTGGTSSLYATQADGTTENASAALTTIAENDIMELIVKVNSTTSVDYYWRKNGGALSSATNLTSNLPTAADDTPIKVSIANTAASQTICKVYQASYER